MSIWNSSAAGSGTVPVSVTTASGTAISPVGFTYIAEGYWMASSDGGVFSFGEAQFFGSMAGTALDAPIVAMADTPDHQGYWLFAADGGVFGFGNARFVGALPPGPGGLGIVPNKPIESAVSSPIGQGVKTADQILASLARYCERV